MTTYGLPDRAVVEKAYNDLYALIIHLPNGRELDACLSSLKTSKMVALGCIDMHTK